MDLETAIRLVVDHVREVEGDISSADAVEYVRNTYFNDEWVDDDVDEGNIPDGDVRDAYVIVIAADGYALGDVLAAHLG